MTPATNAEDRRERLIVLATRLAEEAARIERLLGEVVAELEALADAEKKPEPPRMMVGRHPIDPRTATVCPFDEDQEEPRAR
jgi:hypothetical protein